MTLDFLWCSALNNFLLKNPQYVLSYRTFSCCFESSIQTMIICGEKRWRKGYSKFHETVLWGKKAIGSTEAFMSSRSIKASSHVVWLLPKHDNSQNKANSHHIHFGCEYRLRDIYRLVKLSKNTLFSFQSILFDFLFFIFVFGNC